MWHEMGVKGTGNTQAHHLLFHVRNEIIKRWNWTRLKLLQDGVIVVEILLDEGFLRK